MSFLTSNISTLCRVAEVRRINRAISASLTEIERASLVVTSAQRGEGKSSVCSLLAAAAAVLQGKKVLAIDLNWHRPTLHTQFGLDLFLRYDLLEQGGDPLDQVTSSGVQGLDILSAPAPMTGSRPPALDPSRLALSILEKVRDAYELLLVDTSSIFPTNRFMIDPVLVSAACDGVVLVVMAGVTPRQEVKRSLINLEIAGANVLGTVVNQWQNPINGSWVSRKENGG